MNKMDESIGKKTDQMHMSGEALNGWYTLREQLHVLQLVLEAIREGTPGECDMTKHPIWIESFLHLGEIQFLCKGVIQLADAGELQVFERTI